MDANNVFVGANGPHIVDIFNNDANPIDAANLNNAIDPNNNPNNVGDPNNVVVINNIINPNNFFHRVDERPHVDLIDENNRLELNNAEQNPQPNMIEHL